MGGGTCSNESVSDFTVKEMSLHAQGAREVSPPLTSPSIGSVAVEERSSNGVIDFFHAPLYSLNLGCMLALDFASQNWYLPQGHPLQCSPGLHSWPGLPGCACAPSLDNTDPLSSSHPVCL